MAEDILSQEEVDALLRGVSGESEVQVQASDVPGGIRAYDIGRQERIVRGRMPTLELINERFARGLRVGLFNLARKNAEVAVGPVRVLKYGDFVRNLVVPTNLNLVLAKPLRGTALVVLEPGLVFRVVDNLFGGQGRFHTRIEGRDFTPTEQRIIQRLLRVVLDESEKAWAPVFALQLEYVRSEMNTQFANIATPSEVVVASSFSVDLGTGADDIHICMPYAMLEPVRDIIYSSVQADRSVADDRWLKFISQQVREAPVELVATLGRTMVTVRDLLILQPGDVLAMDLPESVTAEVEGVPLLKGRYGVVNGRYALKVEQVLNGEQDGGE
jgi:flagellar motor switch protein FliM